jgi:hypothetical protein
MILAPGLEPVWCASLIDGDGIRINAQVLQLPPQDLAQSIP